MALNTPDRDQRAFREPGSGLRLVVLCVLSITLMALDQRNQHLQDVRLVLSAATYPIRVLIDAPFALSRWVSENVSTRIVLQDENAELRNRITTQGARLQTFAALEAENARLRSLLDSTAKVGDRVLIAEIMSVDMDPFRHRIVVNKGGNDGVFIGQAMIDAEGIVGQVTRDQVFSAEAILITDVDHAIPVEVIRNRLRTIAVGTGQLDRLSLPYLPRNADVVEGDLLVTSGLGGIFPAGYPVGTIGAINSETGEPFLAIEAEPAAALNRIREVLLIWPGNEPPWISEPSNEPIDEPPPASTRPTDDDQNSGTGSEMENAADDAATPSPQEPPVRSTGETE
jgi:rod shape-determining protein MreC